MYILNGIKKVRINKVTPAEYKRYITKSLVCGYGFIYRTVFANWGFFVIILEPRHTQLLIDHLKENPIDPPWDNDQIISKLQSDIDEKETRTACEHSIATYTGKKTCCSKCGGFPDGEGFSWTMDNQDNEEKTS